MNATENLQPTASVQSKKYRTPLVNQSKKPADKLIKGAFILSLGSIITKVIGAFYRIPLTHLLGSEGLGIYQTAFPVYCILLTLSSTGVPTAIAKLVASGYSEKSVLNRALAIFLPIGALGTVFLCLFSKIIAVSQANERAYLAYIALSPSVFAVTAISCIRGYFQGRANMVPTALSQIIEQAIKLIFGLTLCSLINGSPMLKGALACLAVTLSEIIALLYLIITFKRREDYRFNTFILPFKRLIATLLPVSLSTVLLPISRVFDSFTVIRFLSEYTPLATNLYGIYTGSVESVSGVPVAVCYAIACSVIPTLSRLFAKGEREESKKTVLKAISLTLFLSTASGLALFLFSDLITSVLYSGLTAGEKAITSSLLSLSFFSVIGLSLLQTLNACLVATDRQAVPCIFLAIGVAVKFFIQPKLLKNPDYGIFACLYSDIVCYFVAVFLNLLYIIINYFKERILYENNLDRSWKRGE